VEVKAVVVAAVTMRCIVWRRGRCWRGKTRDEKREGGGGEWRREGFVSRE
jgi:hypothetical protein